MDWFYGTHWVLTFLIFFPLAGAAIALVAPDGKGRSIALAVATIEFLVSLPLFWTFVPGAGMQNEIAVGWIPQWGIQYRIGLDGISLFMVLLTTFLLPLTVLGSWSYIKERTSLFYAMLLALSAGVVGVFVAMDMFLFYVFWEIMLIPMYFMIGIWGGKERIYASVKFFLYTAFGSLLMLVGILYMYFRAQIVLGEGATFAYEAFLRLPLGSGEQLFLFIAFALAFAIKVPIFPFHTWLPHAHVQAPTAGSVVLAGVLLKMGTYGFLRFAIPFFPDAATHTTVITVFMVLSVIGIIYTAMVAAVQPNAKRLVAYTSVAHLGFAILGIFAFNLQGVQGALMVMIGHGLSTPMLFFLLGMMYERRHTYEIEDFGGLAASVPILSSMLVFAALATIGLPGTSGFIAEFLVLLGAFQTSPYLTLIATTGVIFAAYYMLPPLQRIVFNALERPENRRIPDLNIRELAILAPLVVLIIGIGVYPRPFLDRMEPAVAEFVDHVEGARLADRAEEIPTNIAVRP